MSFFIDKHVGNRSFQICRECRFVLLPKYLVVLVN